MMEKSLRAKILWMANHHLRDLMTLLLFGKNQTTSADDKLTLGSGEESDSEDSSEDDSNDLTARSLFAEKMAVCGLPRVPHHQEHVHVILDTPTKTDWCCKTHPK